MFHSLHDLLDEVSVAFETEGISEEDLRNSILDSISDLARKRLGAWHELPTLLDRNVSDLEIIDDLEVYNQWETPNEREKGRKSVSCPA